MSRGHSIVPLSWHTDTHAQFFLLFFFCLYFWMKKQENKTKQESSSSSRDSCYRHFQGYPVWQLTTISDVTIRLIQGNIFLNINNLLIVMLILFRPFECCVSNALMKLLSRRLGKKEKKTSWLKIGRSLDGASGGSSFESKREESGHTRLYIVRQGSSAQCHSPSASSLSLSFRPVSI